MKIAFNTLAVEITRKCHLQCAHCMRGDAQNIDMDNTIITTLLNKTSDIETLAFTGGEPTLNIEGMGFFLDTMIKKNIHLSRLEIVTNGVLLSCQFINLLKRYYDWIEKSDSTYKKYICLIVSKDKYHQGVNVEKAVNFYAEQLKDYSKIFIDIHQIADFGVLPIGRAKNLSIFDSAQKDIYNLQNIPRKTKIEVLTKHNKTFCPLRKFEKAEDGIARILCPIELTVYGAFIRLQNFEYTEEDNLKNKIFDVYDDDILWWINLYNRYLPHCIEFDTLKQLIVEKNLEKYNLKKILTTSDIKSIQNDLKKWNEYIEKYKSYTKTDENEITFEPTKKDVEEITNALIELHKNTITTYLKKKNHCQPTEQEIKKGIAKLYNSYEKILST